MQSNSRKGTPDYGSTTNDSTRGAFGGRNQDTRRAGQRHHQDSPPSTYPSYFRLGSSRKLSIYPPSHASFTAGTIQGIREHTSRLPQRAPIRDQRSRRSTRGHSQLARAGLSCWSSNPTSDSRRTTMGTRSAAVRAASWRKRPFSRNPGDTSPLSPGLTGGYQTRGHRARPAPDSLRAPRLRSHPLGPRRGQRHASPDCQLCPTLHTRAHLAAPERVAGRPACVRRSLRSVLAACYARAPQMGISEHWGPRPTPLWDFSGPRARVPKRPRGVHNLDHF